MSARADRLRKHLKDERVVEFLDIVAEAEGVKHGYYTMFGNTPLNDITDHPRKTVPFTNTKGEVQRSSAAGRYQFIQSTWDHEARELGLTSFSPENQDLAAVSLLDRNGALEAILAGDYPRAFEKAGATWMSLPGAGEKYAQRSRSEAWLNKQIDRMNKLSAAEAGGPGQDDPLYGVSLEEEEEEVLLAPVDGYIGSPSENPSLYPTGYISTPGERPNFDPNSTFGMQIGLKTLHTLGVYGDSPNRKEALEAVFGGSTDPSPIISSIVEERTKEYLESVDLGAAEVYHEGDEEEKAAAIEYSDESRALVQGLHERGAGLDTATAISLLDGEASPKEVGYQAAKLKMGSDVAEFADSRSTGRAIWDFVTHISDVAYLASVLQIGGVSEMLSVDELLDAATLKLHSIDDPLELLDTWAVIRDEVIKNHYNSGTALDILARLASPEDIGMATGYGAGWVALAGTPVALTVGAIGRAVGRIGRESVVLARVGKFREAASSAKAAMSSEEVAALTGSSRAQAANDVSPVKSPISGGAIEGLSEEFQKDVQDFSGRIQGVVRRMLGRETVLDVDTFTPEDLVRAEASLHKQVMNTIESTHVVPSNITVTPVEGSPGKVVLSFEGRPLHNLREGSPRATKAEQDLIRMQVSIKEEYGLLPEGSLQRIEEAMYLQQPTRASLDEVFASLQNNNSVDDAIGLMDWTNRKKFKYEIAATFDDNVGALTQTELPMGASLMSPMGAATKADVRKQVQEALLLDNLSAKIASEFYEQTADIFKSLGRRGRSRGEAKIRAALLDGDEWQEAGIEVGKRFTPEELRAYYKMTDGEIAAYYKVRELADALYPLMNKSMRDEMVRRGYKDIRLSRPISYIDDDGVRQEFVLHDIGLPMDTAKEADTLLGKSGARKIYNPETKEMVNVDTSTIESLYNSGKIVVRLSEATKIPGVKGRVRHLIVDRATEVNNLPQNVHKYKEGWIPRSYKQGQYFVKEVTVGGTLDGAPISRDDLAVRGRTHGLSSNRKAAQALAEQLNKNKDGKTYEVFVADQMDPTELMLSENRSRLYTAGRGERPVPQYEFNRNGELVEAKAARQDPFQALSSAINNVAFHFPRNEWRMSELARLEKSAKDLDVQWNGINQEAVGGSPEANKFINRKRMEMRDWLAMPDSFSEKWDYTIQRVYEAAVGTEIMGKRLTTADGMVGRGLWWIKSHDPVTAMRAASFHMMLGMFNPAQLWVQGQGSAVAFSQLTVALRGHKNVADAIGLQKALMQLENQTPSTARENLRRMVDKGLLGDMSYEEAESFLDGWIRSGLREGVMTNADFRAAESGFGNMWLGAKSWAEGPGMLFYRGGETFSRRLSYVAAYILETQKNPNLRGRILNDSELGHIVARSNDFMLNLGKSNRAGWQKGPLSIPTQFWQVWAKQLEQYLNFSAGKVLTTQEKLKLLMGQIGLYGTHGIPLFGGAIGYGLARNRQFQEGDTLENRMYEEGLWGLAFALIGSDITVASRGAVLADMQGLINDWAFGEEDLSTLLRGAFGNLGIRSHEAVRKLGSLSVTSMMGDGITNPNDLLMFVDALAGLTSTWSNATKALMMHNADKLQTRSGMVIKNKEFNLATEIGVALGMTPLDESRYWTLKQVNDARETARREIRNSIRDLMVDRFRVANLTGEWTEDDDHKLSVLISGLASPLTPQEQFKIAEDLRKELTIGESAWAKEVKKFRDDNLMVFADEILTFWEQMVAGTVDTEY